MRRVPCCPCRNHGRRPRARRSRPHIPSPAALRSSCGRGRDARDHRAAWWRSGSVGISVRVLRCDRRNRSAARPILPACRDRHIQRSSSRRPAAWYSGDNGHPGQGFDRLRAELRSWISSAGIRYVGSLSRDADMPQPSMPSGNRTRFAHSSKPLSK